MSWTKTPPTERGYYWAMMSAVGYSQVLEFDGERWWQIGEEVQTYPEHWTFWPQRIEPPTV